MFIYTNLIHNIIHYTFLENNEIISSAPIAASTQFEYNVGWMDIFISSHKLL